MSNFDINAKSHKLLRWIFENAEKGFYILTATPQMQRIVADNYKAYNAAVYDYSHNNAAYSFGTLAQWAMEQSAKILFILNMQITLRETNDMYNLNFSRDLLTELKHIWIFCMTPDTDEILSYTAMDFYSFVRMHAHFEDEDIINDKQIPILSESATNKYFDSYEDAAQQMQRYDILRDELMDLPINSEPDRLLTAAMTLESIAELYKNYAHYNDALIILLHIKNIRERLLGKGHPDTATTYNNIAGVYDSQGDYPKALEWCQKALDIREKVLGKEHPDTATTYNNIAVVYDNQGDYPKALEWYQKALDINEKILGIEHPYAVLTKDRIMALSLRI